MSAATCFEPWNIMCSNRCAKPVRPGDLVGRPDVVPEVDRHHRQPLVLGEDDLEPVRQREGLVLEARGRVDSLVALRRWCQPLDGARSGGERDDHEDHEK